MFKQYLKIFYNKNAPYKFNLALFLPLIGTAISALSVIVIYSTMLSMEESIKEVVISTEGGATIRPNNIDRNSYDNKINNIQKYLNLNNFNNQRVIVRPSMLSFNGSSFFVNVVGLENVNHIKEAFDLVINEQEFKNGILIGEELSGKLGDPNPEDSMLVISPLDSGVSVSGKFFKCVEPRIHFENPHSIKNISGEYVYIDYNKAKQIFHLARPYIMLVEELSNEDLLKIENDILNVNISSWKDESPLFFSAIKIEKFLYSSFGVIILLIVGFNIFGLINLIVLRKSNQLSLMIYMGSNLKIIGRIFHCNILFIGFVGSLVGSLSSLRIKVPPLVILSFPFSLIKRGFGNLFKTSSRPIFFIVIPGLVSITSDSFLYFINPFRIRAAVDLSSGFRYRIFSPLK